MSNKKYWKFGNIEYQKNTHSQTLLSRLPHLPISVDYQTLARLKIDWTCQILNRTSLLPIHFFLIFTIGIFTFGVLNFFAFFFFVIKDTVLPESLLSLIFWRFAPLFGNSYGPSDSISLYSRHIEDIYFSNQS